MKDTTVSKKSVFWGFFPTLNREVRMEDKEFVGMATCYICGEPKHILLDRRMKKSLPKQACYDQEPCDKCKEHTKKGIILISVRDGEKGGNPYRTGGWVVMKEEAAKRMFNDDRYLKHRIAFVDDTAWDKLGLPRGREGIN